MRQMPVIVEALQALGRRDHLKVMVGGAPVTAKYAREISADGYAPDAASAARLARQLAELPAGARPRPD
jgi:5-methyltetrahydrofolate--homocysteine methyltransferase